MKIYIYVNMNIWINVFNEKKSQQLHTDGMCRSIYMGRLL